MPSVFNKYHNDAPADAVYIGRPSKWGNPFSHLTSTIATYRVASREEAVTAYEDYLMSCPVMVADAKRELKGKDLVCFCKPKACHGDVLLRIANE